MRAHKKRPFPLNVLPGYLFQHDIRSLPENREQHLQVHPPASAYKMPNAKCPDNIAEEVEQQLLLGYVLLKKEKPTSGLHIVSQIFLPFYSPIAFNLSVCSSMINASINSSRFPSRIWSNFWMVSPIR